MCFLVVFLDCNQNFSNALNVLSKWSGVCVRSSNFFLVQTLKQIEFEATVAEAYSQRSKMYYKMSFIKFPHFCSLFLVGFSDGIDSNPSMTTVRILDTSDNGSCFFSLASGTFSEYRAIVIVIRFYFGRKSASV